MGAAILQLHIRKNERLTLGTLRVTEHRNSGDTPDALATTLSRVRIVSPVFAPERLLSKSSSCHGLQSLSHEYPDKTN